MFPLFVHPLRGHVGSAPVANGWQPDRWAAFSVPSALDPSEPLRQSSWSSRATRSGRSAAGGKHDACGEVEGRGVQWVFMGSPSAQKHVYDTQIAALLGIPYISMGGLVSQELHPHSSLYKKIEIDFPAQPFDHVAKAPKLPCALAIWTMSIEPLHPSSDPAREAQTIFLTYVNVNFFTSVNENVVVNESVKVFEVTFHEVYEILWQSMSLLFNRELPCETGTMREKGCRIA
ncbi:hypothetical protein Taro_031985 [Colocasia esculenta]|uniref:Uncharacterized protein n=1 Tax=Colocasia esculenta TaxID=4460 RepID=A0A843VTJ1_COLES|nr:hypothetical protein [Colocasia esculenta]